MDSPFLNDTDQFPPSEPAGLNGVGGRSSSDSRIVPLPDTGSLIEPDQLPTGDDTAVSAGEGDDGVEPPPHPAATSMSAMTEARCLLISRWI